MGSYSLQKATGPTTPLSSSWSLWNSSLICPLLVTTLRKNGVHPGHMEVSLCLHPWSSPPPLLVLATSQMCIQRSLHPNFPSWNACLHPRTNRTAPNRPICTPDRNCQMWIWDRWRGLGMKAHRGLHARRAHPIFFPTLSSTSILHIRTKLSQLAMCRLLVLLLTVAIIETCAGGPRTEFVSCLLPSGGTRIWTSGNLS